MKPFFISSLRLPVVMFAGLTTFLASSSNLAFATPIIDLDTQSGFIGTNDNDTLVGLGLFDVSAGAIALGVDITLFGSGKFDNFVLADAQAHGIDALAGEDLVFISDLLTTTATATTTGAVADVSLTGDASADISINAMAESTGVDGGDDGDTITNASAISSNATADATAVEAVLTIDGGLISNADAGDALVEAGTRSDANATAITGGSGADQINNNASLSASADATTTSVTAGLSIALGANANVSTGAALSDGSSISTALVTGIDAGDGDDTVNNTGEIVLDSSASATGVALSLDVGGSLSGNVATGESMINSRTQADSLGIGIAGGSGSDNIQSLGPIGIASVSTATAVSGSLSLAVGQEGNVVSGGGVSDLSSRASSQAIAIDAGDGDDTIIALSTASPGIDLSADANATGVAVTLDITGSVEGSAAGGAALSNARTDAEAHATGLSAGGGNDQVTNATGINATTTATTSVISADISVGVSVDGDVTSGAAVSDASSLAVTQATGIDGGAGNDTIDSVAAGDDVIALSATSNANGVAASFSVAGSVKGDASVGDALSEARTDADAAATGIAGGIGSDIVTSTTGIDASSAANATAVSVAGSVGVTVDGDVSAGAAVSDASSLASTRSIGIDGGADDDTIGGEDGITGGITASADSTAIGVAASFSVAGSAEGTAQSGDALSEARTDADAEAAGIGGGTGGDTITSATDIDATATSTATAVSGAFSVGVSVDGDVTAGTAVSDASSLAATRATGIGGGAGDDTITSATAGDFTITTTADSEANGVAASFTVGGSVSGAANAGDALSEARTEASAAATGIAGDDGMDTVLSDTGIAATAGSTATAVTTGFSVGIGNEGDVTTGAAVSDASSLATTRAVGIDGGADDDTIGGEDGITGGIISTATSAADGVAASFSVAGSAEGAVEAGDALSEARTDADAKAIGIVGGTGGDTITSATDIDATATSTATAVSGNFSVGVSVDGDVTAGTAVSDASSLAATRATGIGGGAGDDTITSTTAGDFMITTTADAEANGVAASFTVAGSVSGAANGGDALSEARTDASASATGIAGDDGMDTVLSDTGIAATAGSTATAVTTGFSVGIGNEGDVTTGAAVSDASSLATTSAIGIYGGADDDTIGGDDGITGGIISTATSAADGVAASFSVAGSAEGTAQAGDALSEARTDADAEAAGIGGGTGSDTITSATDIDATATSTATAFSIDASVGVTVDGDVTTGTAVSDASSLAATRATGIGGGAGDDTITSTTGEDGAITLQANSIATGVAASFTVAGSASGAATAGDALSEARTDADAQATGIAGGTGVDTILSNTAINATADSDATAVSADFSVSISADGDATAGAAISDASSLARSQATGIDGGEGDDTIGDEQGISGSIKTLADASAVGVGASFSVAGTASGDAAAGDALSEARTEADAVATGISGGAGGDNITVVTGIDSDALATSTAISAGFSVEITKEGSVGSDESPVGSVSDASSVATARAAAIDGGTGVDEISSSTAGGEILDVNADAEATGVGVSVTVSGQMLGDVESGGAMSEATTTAEAEAVAIDSGEDGDEITNTTDVLAISDATATSVNIAIDVGITGDGNVTGMAISDAAGSAMASSLGLDAGSGDDIVTNSGDLDLHSSSDAYGVAVSVEVAGTAGGNVAGGAASDASVVAHSTAVGIGGGSGSDTIYNEGEIRLMDGEEEAVDASATAVAVSLKVSGSLDGDVSSSALSDTSSTAIATGTGIAGDAGVDSIDNLGDIVADVGADSTAVSVSVDAGITLEGDASGAALSDSSTNSQALAAGIDGGNDSDDIDNLADLDIRTMAESDSVSVSVGITGSMQGTASGEAIANTSATSLAESIGIAGGGGDDAIDTTGATFGDETTDATVNANDYRIHTSAASDAYAESVTVSGTGAIGAATGSAIADASANGTAYAAGIDAGSGADTILNASEIDSITNSSAEANSTLVSVGVAVGEADLVGVADSSANAASTAIGIAGGDGGDTIVNSADIFSGRSSDVTMAEARAGSTNVTVTATLGEASGEASANAAAVAEATAEGISGGDGDDTITNEGRIVTGTQAVRGEDIEAQAIAHASSQTVNIGLTVGEAFSNASSESSAIAVSDIAGLAGGAGIDTLTNSGTIDVLSSALAKSESATTDVSMGLGVSERGANADAVSNATAIGAGIDGGLGGDTITTSGDVYVAAQSEALADGSSLSLSIFSIGDNEQSAVANGSSTGDAVARGVFGDAGDDTITAAGTITVRADTSVTSDAEASSVAGFSVGATKQQAQSSADTTARSLAIGIDGGTGSDNINDHAVIDVDSVAYASATGVSATNSGFNLAGVSSGESMSDARTTVDATGVGIRGGESELIDGEPDDDTITVVNSIAVDATAEGNSNSTADTNVVAVFGSAQGRAVSDASAVVRAKGVGIEGGAGDDTIKTGKVVEEEDVVSQGDFAVSANAETEVISMSTVEGDVTFGNASVMGASDASVDMASVAFGIDAGSGADTVMIDSKIDVDAISNGAVTSTSNANADTTFGDASSGAMSDASAMRRAEASGIVGGEGGDTITTSGDARVLVTALSSGNVNSSSYADADSTFGDASSTTASSASSQGVAETTGISGGDGDDDITNLGYVAASSDVLLTVTSMSIATADSGIFGDSYAGAASDTSIAGRAVSTGITGDGGINTIRTEGALSVNARSKTSIVNMTAAIAETETVASSRNAASSEVFAAGINGGNSADTITTGGQIAVAGESVISVTALTVSSEGDASSDARTLTTAYVSGISTGANDDIVTTNGDILVAAAPKVGKSIRTIGTGGNVDGSVGITLQAEASGIDAGAGTDTVTNNGDLLVIVGRQSDSNADVVTDPDTQALVLVDEQLVQQDAEELIGKWIRIDLDNGDILFTIVEDFDPETKTITTRDPLPATLADETMYTLFDVDSDGADIEVSEVTIGGRVKVDAATQGNVTASGISGGAGDDEITNNGNVAVKASNFTEAGIRTVSGNIQSDLSTRSNVFGIGIDGDALDLEVTGGADVLKNFGDVNVEATSSIDFGASKLLYYGQSSIDAAGEAQATAIGMRGGEMNDMVVHSGNLYITSEASILAEEKSVTLFSDIEQQLDFAASGESVGISAGDGDDVVMSSGNVEVSSTAQGSVIGSTTTIESFFNIFLGIDEPRTENIVNVSLDGTGRGLDLGAGADVVENTGDLTVLALAVPVGADEYVALAISEGNETGARATAVNTAVATGIGGDSGTHQVTNSGVIDVGAESVATSFAQAAEVLTADDQSTITSIDQPDQFVDEALAGTELNFTGKELRLTGSDDGFTRLDSNVTAVDSDLAANQFEDSTATSVDPDSVIGTRIRFKSDNPDVAEFESVVTGYEVVADNGGTTAVFTLEDPLPTDNGNDLVAVDDAYRLSVLTATVTQFDATSGTFTLNEVVPDGATDEAYTLSVVSSDATLGLNSYTFVDMSRKFEDPDDFVGNWVSFPNAPDDFAARIESFESGTGTFTLTCVEGCIEFDVFAGDIYELSLTHDGTSGSDAAANAYGIDLRGGDASITNSGEILVTATADASTVVNVSFGTENASADATAVAFGIRTGNGNDTITNEEAATISVVTEAMSETNTGEQSTTATATGIETGAGADVVTNNGLVSALTYTNGVATSGTGIDLGAGDDALILGDGSEVIGTVTLGDDNDSLTLVGTPIVRDASGASINPQAGAGIDALILEGAGAFAGVPVGFEHATKTGTGTYALPQLATLDSLTIEEGMLQLGSDYDFAVDGQFSTYFHSDGDHGRLSVDGDSVLNGAINVEKRGNTYISNGSRYSLVQTSGTLNNAFADVTLPASTPLLSYDLEQTVNSIDTVVTAASFSTATDNPLYRQIARNLDSIADDASGDMAFVLGTLQSLESGFDQAFASASPDSHLVTTQTTVATGQQAARLLQNHMASSRAVYRQSIQGQSASGNVSFAYNNGVGAIGLSTTPKVTGHKDTRLMLAANEYSDTGVGQTLPRQIDVWGKKLIFSDTVESETLPLQTKAKSQAWIQGGKAYGDYDEIDGYTGFETDSNILALGYDFRLNERFIIGGTLGYAKTDLDMSTASANGQIEAWSGGAYANWFNDKAYLDGGIVYANQSYDTQRAVVVGSISRTATSQHDGSVWMGFLGSGYQFDSDSWFFEPYGSLYYFNVKEDGFTETGAGSLNQTIEGRTTEALIGELGAKAAWLQKLGKGMLDLHGTLGLNYDFNIDDARISYSYAGAPGDVFIIDDRNLERNSAVFGAGVSYTSGNSSFSLDYRRLQNNDFNNDSIFAGLEVRF